MAERHIPREVRRKLERDLNLQVNESFDEYFTKPNKSVRRADLFEITLRLIELDRLRRKRNRWYRRLWRWWLRLLGFDEEAE